MCVFFSLFIYRRIEYDLKSPANATQGILVNTRSPELHHKQIRQDSISSDLSNLTVDQDGMILMKSTLFFLLIKYIFR
jgi:hypothetical protein